ncbi:MAG: TolC family protein [Phycisphaerae bacterium]
MNERPARRFPRMAALAAAVWLLAPGCCDPFRGWDCMDFDVGPERLGRIERLSLQPVDADDPDHPTTAPASRPATTQPADEQAPAELKLTLEQCRALALEGNLDLKVQLLSPTVAAESVTEAEAQFEGLLVADVAYSKTDTPVSSGLSGSAVESLSVTPGMRLPLRTGGSVSVDMPVNRLETDNAFSTLNPAHTADLRLSLSQPLLRGAGVWANTHAIRIARWEHKRSQAMAKLEVIRVLAAADRVYWRLYAAGRELEVRRQEHALAQAQLDRARRQVEAGDKPEVEVLRAQLGVAEKREAIIIAANELRRRQRDLKRILQKPDMPMASRTVVLTATPPSIARYKLDGERLVKLASGNRMELLAMELQIAEDASAVGFERNRTLPLVTLAYTYNINGLGPARSDAFDLMFEKRFEDHYLGVQVEVPVGNQAARSRLRRAILQRIQRIATREQQKALIEQEVRDSIDQLGANWQRILASRGRVVLAERVLAAEQRQFDQGLRTSTEVLEAQTALADAQSAEISALVEYQAAQVDLAVATGTLTGAARVRWAPTVPPEIAKE